MPTQGEGSGIARGVQVTIVGGHPHTGCVGTTTGDVINPWFSPVPLYKVRLWRCDHGEEACYAARRELMTEVDRWVRRPNPIINAE